LNFENSVIVSSFDIRISNFNPFDSVRDPKVFLCKTILRKRFDERFCAMRLELHKHRIEEVEWGKRTELQGHTLLINKTELIEALTTEASPVADVVICRPGEKVRITNILDILEPRAKAKGGGEVFPGFLSPSEKVGNGVTKVLEGIAVVEVAPIPRVQEGLVDMGGAGAIYSPFSRTNNIVLVFEQRAGSALTEFETGVRLAGLRACNYLAKAGLDSNPDENETFELDWEGSGPEQERGLQRIGYVYMLQSQGFLRDTFLYGRSVSELTATQIHPNEIMDGAIVSGNYVIPSNRNPTYFHLNNPIIRELTLRHGHDLLFIGLVVCNEHSRLEDKERTSQEVVRTLKACNVEGVIITKEGGGNADTDLMFMCSSCESLGIRTVLLSNEGAGPDGRDPSLAHSTPEANGFVSTGNNDEPVALDPVDKLIGQGPLPGVTEDLKGKLTVPVSRISGATNLLGYGMLTCTTS
jgi:glycine reductase